MTQITKELYRDAHESKQVLATVIEALKTIKMSHIFNDSQASERINAITCELQAFLNSWQGIINDGHQAYRDRPEELIKKASHRLLNEIPKQIHLEQATLKHHIDARQMKVEELKKKGFGPAEIDRLYPAGPEVDVEASTARVAALEAEAKAIQEFLADSPRFDTGLLKNTDLAPLISQKEAA